MPSNATLNASPSSPLTQARQTYEPLRTFHGTTAINKADIQVHGFTRERKVEGATEAALADDPELRSRRGFEGTWQRCEIRAYKHAARQHHYLTRSAEFGANFAALVTVPPQMPALVRVIGSPEDLMLEHDCDCEHQDLLRTPRNIPADHVLGSKKSRHRRAAELFRPHLERAFKRPVSTSEAARWLQTVQSDSEADMDEPPEAADRRAQ